MDQIVRFAVPGCGFDQLPPGPDSGGMVGDLEVDQLATTMADEEEDVEGLEVQGLDDEQVGDPGRLSMVGQEGAPALVGWAGMTAPTITADRAGADDDAELEELAADALGAPERILAGHSRDQLPDLGTQPRPAQMSA
jgi:hypothetical protein